MNEPGLRHAEPHSLAIGDWLLASRKGETLLGVATRRRDRRVQDMHAVMLKLDGHTQAAIGRHMGVSREAAANRIQRGAPYVASILNAIRDTDPGGRLIRSIR